MKRSMLLLVAALAATACNEKETRSGQLTLAGSAPVRIADQNGATVEFYTGPLKVEFNADGRDAKIKLEQNGRAAEFKARIPRRADWNLTLKGSDIGQPIDLASARKVELYGDQWRQIGRGGPCGMGGHYQTEEIWQKGNEDWTVGFNDAATGAKLGTFASRLEGVDYLIRSHDLWCVGERDRGGRWDRTSLKLDELKENGIKFE